MMYDEILYPRDVYSITHVRFPSLNFLLQLYTFYANADVFTSDDFP